MFRSIPSSRNPQPGLPAGMPSRPAAPSAQVPIRLGLHHGQPVHHLPAGLAGLPRGVQARAASRPDPANYPTTLQGLLAANKLPIPVGHPGFGFEATLEIRKALRILCRRPGDAPGMAIRDACVIGYRPRFEALICLIEHGAMCPNVRFEHDFKGETLLHSIASEACDGAD